MSFEIDQRLIPVLEDTLAPYDNVTIINEDILKANISKAVHTHLSDCEKSWLWQIYLIILLRLYY